MPAIDYFTLGLICSCLSILGDLIESFIKRCSNVKDTGTFLPEHGGLYDRMDSLHYIIPFLYWYLLQLVRIQQLPGYDPSGIQIL